MVPNTYKTKDSGQRIRFSTGMQRDATQGKPRYDLIIPLESKNPLLKRWASLMARGGEKYNSKKIDISPNSMLKWINEELLCQGVENIKIELFTQRDIVGLATRYACEKIIQNLQNVSVKTELTGVEEILKKLKPSINKESLTPIAGSGMQKPNKLVPLERSDSLAKQVSYYWKNRKINVGSVVSLYESAQNILIMTIKQDSQEVTYVMGAIGVLECLETTLTVLGKQYNIFKNIQLETSLTGNLLLTIPSPRNWEKASTQEELSRFKESAFRHFMQWFLGEDDEDHAVATLFNIQGAEYVKERLGTAT